MALIDRACVECRKPSPETQTQYTLISRYGWRVTRATSPEGETVLEWRCPPCWASYKARKPRASSLPPPGASAPPPALPRSVPAPAEDEERASHAGAARLFDRAVEALASKPPRPRQKNGE